MTARETYFADLCAKFGCGKETAEKPVRGTPFLSEKDPAPLLRGLNAVVPVSLAETDGFLFAAAYPAFSGAAADFLSGYADDAFSDAALSALDGRLASLLPAYGYQRAKFPDRYAYSCLVLSPERIPDLSVPGLCRLDHENIRGLSNRTSMKLADCVRYASYAVIRDSAAVCIAAVNSANGAGRCREIGVECAPDFRRQGFAASCVSVLARELCSAGEVPLYQYYRTNEGSARTAARAGFSVVGRFFSYTSFHK